MRLAIPKPKGGDLKSISDFNSDWADRIALLILFGLVIDIAAALILGKGWIEKALAIAANSSIIIGVWGELWFLKRARQADDGRVAEANKAAEEARERAAKADLARIELEARLAPRMLNQEQVALIESLREKFFSINIAYEADSEAWWFATELAKAFVYNGLAPHIFVRDPSVHSFSVMIFEPSGFDGASPKTVGPLVELFKDQQTYGSAAIISHLPTDILLNAGDDPEARATLLNTPMVIIGGRFIVPPAHWPKPPKKM